MYSFDEFHATRRFAGLDGLRAASILLVIVCHMPRLPSRILRNLQENGSSGVSLFFVISGFLIAMLLLRDDRTRARGMRGVSPCLRFLARRAIRLWPAYYAVLGAVLVIASCTSVFSAQSSTVLRHNAEVYACYMSNWLPDRDGPFFYSWSLAAEEQFYVGFAVMLYGCGRRALQWLVMLGLPAAIGLHFALGQAMSASVLARMVASVQEPILWGVVIALVVQTPAGYGRVRRVVASPVPVGLSAAGWAWWCTMPPGSAFHAELEHLLYPAMAVIVAAVVVRPPSRVLDAKPAVFIGQISYGIYLVHWLVIVALERLMPQGSSLLLYFGLCVAVVTAIAWAMARFFERPVIAYLRPRIEGTARTRKRAACANGAYANRAYANVQHPISNVQRPSNGELDPKPIEQKETKVTKGSNRGPRSTRNWIDVGRGRRTPPGGG